MSGAEGRNAGRQHQTQPSTEAIAAVILPGMDGSGTLRSRFAEALRPQFVPMLVSFPFDRPLGYSELGQLVRAALADRRAG